MSVVARSPASTRLAPLPMGLFLVVALCWGINYPVVVLGLREAPPLWLAFLRVAVGLLGSLALLPILRRRRGSLPLSPRQRVGALLLGLPNSALFFGLWMVAATAVPAGPASVIIYTFPLWVLLLSYPLLGHRPHPAAVGAALLGFLGVAVIGFSGASVWEGGWVPFFELLGAAASWAVATVLIKRTFQGPQMLEANAWQLAGGALPLLAFAWAAAPPAAVHMDLPLLLEVLWLGILGTAVAYGLWFELLADHLAATLSAYLFLVPVVAIVGGFLLLGQGLGLTEALGVAAILLSIYLTHRSAPEDEDAVPASSA